MCAYFTVKVAETAKPSWPKGSHLRSGQTFGCDQVSKQSNAGKVAVKLNWEKGLWTTGQVLICKITRQMQHISTNWKLCRQLNTVHTNRRVKTVASDLSLRL